MRCSYVEPPHVLLLQGEVQALFLRHEGYLGAIGAFLKGAEEDSKDILVWYILPSGRSTKKELIKNLEELEFLHRNVGRWRCWGKS